MSDSTDDPDLEPQETSMLLNVIKSASSFVILNQDVKGGQRTFFSLKHLVGVLIRTSCLELIGSVGNLTLESQCSLEKLLKACSFIR